LLEILVHVTVVGRTLMAWVRPMRARIAIGMKINIFTVLTVEA
jgi:hypothetical protein